VLEKYLSYNTTDRHPIMVLIDAGVLKIHSEEEVKKLMTEIRERRKYDPFTDFGAVPDGQMLEALRRVRDERIDITQEKQLMELLHRLNGF
jgi:hypothetical protein